MNNKIFLLEKKIGINFKDKKLLIKSLTHKSFNSNNNYEKLEFLGDRVLGLIISKTLLEIFPEDKEGSLDKKLASLVNRKKCCEISKKLNLENFVITGNAKSKKNKIEDKIISDACEALIGAIYLDQGLSSAEKFILKFWKSSLNLSIKNQVDAKTKLQEYSLKKYKTLPKYKLLSSTGPRHKPVFKIGVSIDGSKIFSASGYSKKDAEQKAAALFLKKIGL
jgi:ribonuclease-3